jgi:hypothetical protein
MFMSSVHVLLQSISFVPLSFCSVPFGKSYKQLLVVNN